MVEVATLTLATKRPSVLQAVAAAAVGWWRPRMVHAISHHSFPVVVVEVVAVAVPVVEVVEGKHLYGVAM
jgi:hypothetical protein